MKKINCIIFILFIAILTLNSCQDADFLQENPKAITTSTFLSNAQEDEGVINSIYVELRRTEIFGRDAMIVREALADYCYGRGSYAFNYQEGIGGGSVTHTNDMWAVLYRAIRFANQFLVSVKKSGITNEQYLQFTAEVRFLRALCYANLVRDWGAAPLYTEKNMNDFNNKPRVPVSEIRTYIISELEYCSENLPTDVTQIGRPTKYAALALLTQVYLYTKQYSQADSTAEEIINSDKYHLVSLSSPADFINIYGPDLVTSPEEIFYFKYSRLNGSLFAWMYAANPNPFVGNTGALGIWTDKVKNKFIANWDTTDFRYQYFLYRESRNGTLNALTKYGMICSKYREPDRLAGSTTANDNPVIKYSDVLLWYAEAVCRANGGPTPDAMEKVNMIHRRAYGYDPTSLSPIDYKLSDYDTEEAFLKLVLKEEGYEDIFEGKRYDVLKRFGKLREYVTAAKDVTQIDTAAFSFPIPSTEFDYNKALDPSDQNPGY